MAIPEKKTKILVIDDEEQIRRALKSILSTRSYEVHLASSGEEGLDMAVNLPPDLVILDISMPGLSGIDVCRELRTWLSSPILILSVKGADSDKILALDTGADDYLTKPFSAGELLARIRALLRRASASIVASPIITVGDLEVDIAHRRVKRAGEEIVLTRIEFDILSFLAHNADCVTTSKMILRQIWGPEYTEDIQTLRVHISNLRKKIEPHPSVPRFILTEPGVGFRLATT
jgi:two-component system, OmpR family, KDP operon response regulator KdpE